MASYGFGRTIGGRLVLRADEVERAILADVVTQLAAVSKALDKAGFAIIASGLQQCLVENPGDTTAIDVQRLEKLFLSLA